jgi:Domain of unknown function (DUF4157)
LSYVPPQRQNKTDPRSIGHIPHTIYGNQSSDSISNFPQVINNQEVPEILADVHFDFKQIGIQPKLKVSQPSDKYEQEADQVAEQIMRMLSPHRATRLMDDSTGQVVRRKCSSCKIRDKDDEEKINNAKISRKATLSFSQPEVATSIMNETTIIHPSTGISLDSKTKALMESHFAHDFGRVRIHADEKAALSAKYVKARAYTVGNNIVFGQGEYQPGTREGKRLLAHELTHVMQQTGTSAAFAQEGEAEQATPKTEYQTDVKDAISRGISSIIPGESAILEQSYRSTIMRTPIFTSTMDICRRILKSRVFHISQGGLIVSADAGWEASAEWQGSEAPMCGEAIYNMTLNKKGWLFDSEYGSCEFAMGRSFLRTWGNLPEGDYYLTIWTNNTNPNCCLRGDITVSEERGIGGQTCTELPPGPLEILHTALDLAGLIPALGVVPDAINAGIYLIEGDWVNAGISAVSIIPIFGDAATVVRVGRRTIVKVEGEAVERIGREGIARGVKEARASRPIGRVVEHDIEEAVERGIREEVVVQGPARPIRPRPAPRTGLVEAARQRFNQLRGSYAARLGVSKGGQVHHAIELQVLDRYPGVFTEVDLNAFQNMRGIATELAERRQLHNSKIREMWDRHYSNLDAQIAAQGLHPGTPAYDDFVRRYLMDARDEIDHVLGQFFTEYRTGRPRSFR